MTPSWIPVPEGSDFPITNLPYGVATHGDRPAHVVTRIGDHVVSLGALASGGLLDDVEEVSDPLAVFAVGWLNPFMALGPQAWAAVRARLTELFSAASHESAVKPYLVPAAHPEIALHLPFAVADYVDFYSSEDHATNLGKIFRPDGEALMPNWKHLPIGYHGRAGTVVPSGTPVIRPSGQRTVPTGAGGRLPSEEEPRFGPSVRLDIEAEVGFVVGVPTPLGARVTVDSFTDHVFGAVLVNDWSARDIQAWEYQPLGPFLGKSFATSISPWVVPLAALADARVAPPTQDPVPLPYLLGETWGYDLTMQVRLNGALVSQPPFAGLYWTPGQQLAHMTANGACLRTGDLYASGTVSGPRPDQRGSFIELTWNGTEPLALPDGTSRGFLVDGDTVSITATAPGRDGTRIGFGEVVGTIQPAR